jgi:hypothetical protein
MVRFAVLQAIVLAFASTVTSIPQYGSLAGLSERELTDYISTLDLRALPGGVPRPPGPLAFTGTQLSNDAAHPFEPLQPGDQRGPCPALNTLASHGFIPRNGVATPAQIIDGVQEGLNMGNDLAIFLVYNALLVDGNVLTNLLSIGGLTPLTGTPPPAPAIAAGIDHHGTFEGDTSMTRQDAFFGNQFDFNEPLFDQFLEFSNMYGGGFYNITAAAKLRQQRVAQSTATNPDFVYVAPRYFTAYSEAVLPFLLFVDGRVGDKRLSQSAARDFFDFHMLPDDFFRANFSATLSLVGASEFTIFDLEPTFPGTNVNGVNTFTQQPQTAQLGDLCKFYTSFIMDQVVPQYPNPKGILREKLQGNLDNYFTAFAGQNCTQIFPFGK